MRRMNISDHDTMLCHALMDGLFDNPPPALKKYVDAYKELARDLRRVIWFFNSHLSVFEIALFIAHCLVLSMIVNLDRLGVVKDDYKSRRLYYSKSYIYFRSKGRGKTH